MARLETRECQLLVALAEHRALTPGLLASVLGRNVRALRRRLGFLIRDGLIETSLWHRDGRPGRAERVLALTPSGATLLKTRNLLDAHVPEERATMPAAATLPHLLLINEFRAALIQMQRKMPQLAVRFLSATSPFLTPSADTQPLVHESFLGPTGQRFAFTPDGVFAMTHAEFGKTLLSFLEVDMGTEALAGSGTHRGNLWQKITTYQAYYNAAHYKRYERVFDCALRRFRLLILTRSSPRLMAICRLVREMAPAEFVLLTDHPSVLAQGVWGEIWIAEGRLDRPRVSILGGAAPLRPQRSAVRT